MKKTLLKICLIISLFILFLGSSYAGPTDENQNKIDAKKAKEIAVSFLGQQKWSGDYILDSCEVRNSYSNVGNWEVVFKHINWKTRRPSHGIVIVNKISGEASWLPLR